MAQRSKPTPSQLEADRLQNLISLYEIAIGANAALSAKGGRERFVVTGPASRLRRRAR